MANIQEDINQIATARYGRDVRGSIVNALILMNDESSEAIDKAVTAQDSAVASATEAKSYADRLVDFGGGTTGQVLTKKSNADFDYSWEESQGGTSDAYETTYGESNVGDTLDIMPRLAGAVQGTSPTPKKDTLLDKDGNEIYLKTVTDNVFDSEGNRLDNVIGSIKENLVWKKVGTTKAKNPLPLPSEWKELLITLSVSGINSYAHMPTYIVRDFIIEGRNA